ncbi:hypothetical protein Holit_02961 [Hollandina sp. SP2]
MNRGTEEVSESQFEVIRYVRMMLRDPAGMNAIIPADSYPAEPYPGTAYLIDNRYQVWNTRKKQWETLTPALSDPYILEVIRLKGRARGIIALIDGIIMGIQAGGATHISAGAESVTMLSPREQLEFLLAKKRILLSQMGLSGGRICTTRRRVIGGVREEW